MTPALAVLGLAALDALNPFSIAAMAVLLTTDRPLARGLAFVAGTLLVYLPFGAALLAGWTALMSRLLPLLPPWAPGTLLLAAGLACLAAGAWAWGRAGAGAPLRASTLSVGATLMLAAGSTLSDLPTAVPYLAAAPQVARLAGGAGGQAAWLALYNLVYVAPLLAMLGARLALGVRAEAFSEGVTRAVEWAFARLLPPFPCSWPGSRWSPSARRGFPREPHVRSDAMTPSDPCAAPAHPGEPPARAAGGEVGRLAARPWRGRAARLRAGRHHPRQRALLRRAHPRRPAAGGLGDELALAAALGARRSKFFLISSFLFGFAATLAADARAGPPEQAALRSQAPRRRGLRAFARRAALRGRHPDALLCAGRAPLAARHLAPARS
jgi:hypothetical protein